MNTSIAVRTVVFITGLLLSTAALAHHSYAIFDNSKVVPMTMTVTKFNWANPHAWIYGMVKDENGAEAEWALECRSPNELSRQGLRSIDIKPGDKLVADVWLSRDGAKIATIIRATTAEGKKFGRTRDDIAGTGQPTGGGPGVAPR